MLKTNRGKLSTTQTSITSKKQTSQVETVKVQQPNQQLLQKILVYSCQRSSCLYSILEIQIPSEVKNGKTSTVIPKFQRDNMKNSRVLDTKSNNDKFRYAVLAISQYDSQVFIGLIKLTKIEQNSIKQRLKDNLFDYTWELNSDNLGVQCQSQIKGNQEKLYITLTFQQRITLNIYNYDLYCRWQSMLAEFKENANLTKIIPVILTNFINKQSFDKLLDSQLQKYEVFEQKQELESIKINHKNKIKEQQFQKSNFSIIQVNQPFKQTIQFINTKLQQYEKSLFDSNNQKQKIRKELQHYKSLQGSRVQFQRQSKISNRTQQSFIQKQNSLNNQTLSQIKQSIKEIRSKINEFTQAKNQSLGKEYFDQNFQNLIKIKQQSQKENQIKVSQRNTLHKQIEMNKQNRDNIATQLQKMMNKIDNIVKGLGQRQDKAVSREYFDTKIQYLAKIMNQQEKRQNQNQFQQQLLQLKTQIGNLQNQIRKKNKQIQGKQEEISELTNLSQTLQQQHNQIKKNIQHLQTEKSQLNSQIQQLNNKISTLENNLDLKVNQLNNQKLAVKNIELQKAQIAQKLVQQTEKYESQASQKQRQMGQMQYELNQAKIKALQVTSLQQKLHYMTSLMREKDSEILYHIFQGEVLHSCEEQKSFLKKQIESYTKKEILYTSRLYKYDTLNPTNYHKYFDQQENIGVLIKLTNGRIISGFSVSPISTKVPASKGGIICSLTQKKCFKLIEGKRSVTYDAFFMIFGNSELRLKHGEPKFFTNFGIANSFYESNGQKYTVLNGEGSQREEPLQTFQVFKVIFK